MRMKPIILYSSCLTKWCDLNFSYLHKFCILRINWLKNCILGSTNTLLACMLLHIYIYISLIRYVLFSEVQKDGGANPTFWSLFLTLLDIHFKIYENISWVAHKTGKIIYHNKGSISRKKNPNKTTSNIFVQLWIYLKLYFMQEQHES